MSIKSGAGAALTGLLLVAACTAPSPAGPSPASGGPGRPGQSELRIVTQIGEQCPHIPVTPDPRCDPKPLPDTAFKITTPGGDPVTNGRTGGDGRASVFVDPGQYVVRGEPVAGYEFTPERKVTAAGGDGVAVPLTYTTGIQ
ncbi:MAG: hypothetical protein HOV79_00850 [Hamadaea sp.]|nr:hypothetical protein [Hamadaea sp.]